MTRWNLSAAGTPDETSAACTASRTPCLNSRDLGLRSVRVTSGMSHSPFGWLPECADASASDQPADDTEVGRQDARQPYGPTQKQQSERKCCTPEQRAPGTERERCCTQC